MFDHAYWLKSILALSLELFVYNRAVLIRRTMWNDRIYIRLTLLCVWLIMNIFFSRFCIELILWRLGNSCHVGYYFRNLNLEHWCYGPKFSLYFLFFSLFHFLLWLLVCLVWVDPVNTLTLLQCRKYCVFYDRGLTCFFQFISDKLLKIY